MKNNWSKYQLDIFDVWEEGTYNLLIQAVAGSGKSTTLLELAKRSKGRSLFLAFNKSIVDELSLKVQSEANIIVQTLHSLGCKSLFAAYGALKINQYKNNKFIAKHLERWEIDSKQTARTYTCVSQLVDFYRLTLCETKEQLVEVAYNAGLEFDLKHAAFAMDIIKDLEKYNSNPKEIDFTDMVYLPVKNELRLPRYTNVFVDECQDLNNTQHALVERLTANSRVVYVGDRYQSIYGFAGANTQSFNRILNRENIKEMPLTVCYRCPKAVVKQANQVYDIIESPKWIDEGEVRVGKAQEAQSGDMIICRNLRPLIGIYFDLIGEQKKAFIKGKDIGESLIKLIKQHSKCQSLQELFGELQKDVQNLVNQLLERGVPAPTKHPSYEALSQKIGAIIQLSDYYFTIDDMVSNLTTIFKEDEKEGIMLSTIHKSKGLESSNVFLVNRKLIGANANTAQQLEQERNLLYVAITRSKKSLIYCSH